MNLFQAAKKGNLKDVKDCLARKESVSMIDNSGLTPLHWAAILDRPDIIEYLIKQGAIIDAPGTRLKVTPLHLAVFENNVDSVNKLLSLGANIEAESNLGKTALDLIFFLSENHDVIGGLAKHLPFVKLYEKSNYAFDVLVALLAYNPDIKDVKQFEKIMFYALVHDRVDVLEAIMEKGYHYRNLQDDMSIVVGGVPLPFDIAIGYDYAIIIAMSNGSLNCLKYINSLDPQCFLAKTKSISEVSQSNPLHWMAQQMPETAMFDAVFEFLKLQETQQLELATIASHIPSALRPFAEDVYFNYDAKLQRYYISSALVGGCALYFDENGRPKEMEKRIQKLKETLNYFKDTHNITVTAEDKLGEYVGQYLVKCPIEIMQVFIDFGVTFKGREFHRALKIQTPDVIKAMIPVSDIHWKNKEGLSSLDVLKNSENDALLNEMPVLIKMIEQILKSKEASEKKVDMLTADCLSSDATALTPSFDKKKKAASLSKKATSDLDNTEEEAIHPICKGL